MKPQFEHIMTFIQVVEQESFNGAAKVLGVSKSVISKHITALEYSLKTQLLERSSRKCTPTAMGLSYYHQIKQIPALLDHAHNVLQTLNTEPHGLLKVIAPSHFNHSFKNIIIPDFLTTYPEITLQLRLELAVEECINEDFDIIILWKLHTESFPNYPLIGKKLFTMPTGLYATPDYLARHGTPTNPQDLLQHNCFSSEGDRFPFINPKGEIAYQKVSGNLHTTNDDIIYGATMHNVGITYSYPFLFHKELQSGQVVRLFNDYPTLFIDVYAFYHPGPYCPVKIKVFIEKLTMYYQMMQPAILERGQPVAGNEAVHAAEDHDKQLTKHPRLETATEE